jgi:glutamate formiminotransferase / formiminotetrahydrofolate cyclodeaminase
MIRLRLKVIEAIAKAISNTNGCHLLDVDAGSSTNRTVYTFVGAPDNVVEGALAAARTAQLLINMEKQKGEHPRLGAMDVCPFIPVRNISVKDCVELSKKFGKMLADQLNIPVYLYGESQTKDYRKELPAIRQGEYEGLKEKLKDSRWAPDFGPAEFRPSFGASCVGVRSFLIAYNVNLLGTKEQAHRIALNIREQGRSENEPGRLKKVKAIGWLLAEEQMAQISMNLTDFKVTNIHQAFEECDKDARELNTSTCGSQLVGLIPLESILAAADHYIKKENLLILEEENKVKLVINRLGLNSISQFDPKKRIIE